MDDARETAVERLAQQMRLVERERIRLNEVRQAHHVVSNSRFARLRVMVRAAAQTFGIGGKVQPLDPAAVNAPPVRITIHGARPSGDAGAAGRLLYEMESERLNLVDALELSRRKVSALTARLDAASRDLIALTDALDAATQAGRSDDAYQAWLDRHAVTDDDLGRLRVLGRLLPYRPTISVIMATYNTPAPLLRAAIDSVVAQTYEAWELCVADDASTDPHVIRILEDYAAADPRIKLVVRKQNGHISLATNSALELAGGDFIGLLDHDDLLTPDALFEAVLALNADPTLDMIYSDEDKVDEAGRLCEPHFKPDWSPESYLSRNYTCHFGVYRRSLVESLGGMRPGFEGSQDYDLVLRLTELSERIHHIPKVLYHWRKHAQSTSADGAAKPYARAAAIKALNEALQRRGEPGLASERHDCPGVYVVRFAIRKQDRVTIIVPTRDHGEDVDRCLEGIFRKGGYDNVEVVLLDNGSTEPASLAIFEAWAKRERRVRVLRYDVPFNYSRINNYAVAHSGGEYLLLLNNDTEAESESWIAAMLEQAQRPPIGAVGAQLLYGDRTIQHAGVVTGVLGLAGHMHRNLPASSPGYFATLKSICNYTAVTAACLMLKRSAFEAVGGFDEGLAVAFNDIDFCLKLVKTGYRNVYLPHVVLYHHESKSRGTEDTPERRQRFEQEVTTVLERWDLLNAPDPCYNINLTRLREDFGIRTAEEYELSGRRALAASV
jgi:GT2 family glycosyltransferase